jgi:hypothetical protein
MVAFLLTAWVFLRGFEPEPTISTDVLLGQWEVFNDAEPELYAVWKFTQGGNNIVQVTGEVWATNDPKAMGHPNNLQTVMSFGPHQVTFRYPGTIVFNYESDRGSGQAEMSLSHGLIGRYVDDPSKTDETQVDSGRIAIYRERVDRLSYLYRAVAIRSIYTILLGWVSTLLAYLLFSFLKSQGMVTEDEGSPNDQKTSGDQSPPSSVGRSLRKFFPTIKLSGPIAFFYVFFPLSATLVDIKTPSVGTLSREALLGPWEMQYLNDRTRVGKLFISRTQDEQWSITGDLYFRPVPPERGVKPRAKWTASSVKVDPSSEELVYIYNSPVGTGETRLKPTVTLRGHYTDNISSSPTGQANAGDLLALKK